MGGHRDRDLDEELRAHLEMATRDRIDRGENPEAAAAGARREFGNVLRVREHTRDVWSWTRLERLTLDIKYGFRQLHRSPLFSLVVIASLALGIGTTTAIFSVLNAVRLRPLPVPRPHELVEIAPVTMDGARGSFAIWRNSVSNPIWEQVRDRQEAFSGTLAFGGASFNLASGGESRPARGLFVSGSYFDVLEIRPALGRLLSAADDRRGCAPRAVVSDQFWEREFARRPDVVGRTLGLEGVPFEIIGVVPAHFSGLEVGRGFDLAIPICAEPALAGGAGRFDAATAWWLIAMGRLAPGVTVAQASAHLQRLSPDVFRSTLAPDYPAVSVPKYLQMQLQALPASTGVSYLRETYEQSLWVLLSLAALVLLIACANLANLMLARASAREREMAIRLGLGASRARVIRQLLTETVVLAAIGALGASALAQIFSAALVTFVDGTQREIALRLDPDWRVIGFTAGLAALTCALCGLLPAIRATRIGPSAVLKDTGRGLTAARESTAWRRSLAMAQVALSMVLLFGALLFMRTLRNLADVDAGFTRESIVMTGVDLRRLSLPVDRRIAFKHELLDALRAVRGVESAATTTLVPLSGDATGNNITLETPGDARVINMLSDRVSQGYFATFGIPLIAGRDFDPVRDTASGPRVAIVNRTLAANYPGGNAVGGRFHHEATPYQPAADYEIVGVVADSKYLSLRQEPYPVVYFPMAQDPRPSRGALVALRARSDPAALTPAILQTLREIDPNIGASFTMLDTFIERTLLRERLMATLSMFFGVLAAALAVIGLYGLFAYTVVRRTNEIGIRMALGASGRGIVWMVLRDAAGLIAAGLIIGVSLALLTGRYAETLLYGLEPRDPVSIAIAAVLLGGVALLAGYLPARSASRIEPVTALRAE